MPASSLTQTTRGRSGTRCWRSGGGGRRTACPSRSGFVPVCSSNTRGARGRFGWPRFSKRLGIADRLRVLVAGWLNSPHVRAWAELVTAAGHDVQIAGRIAPGWPELELPVPAHRLPAHWPPPLRGFAMSRALGRVAREVDPDLVHAHYLPEYGWMAARERLRPLICSAWGSDVFALNTVNRLRAKKALDAGDARLRRLRAPGAGDPRARSPGRASRGRALGARPRGLLPG